MSDGLSMCKCGHLLAQHFFNRVCLVCHDKCEKVEIVPAAPQSDQPGQGESPIMLPPIDIFAHKQHVPSAAGAGHYASYANHCAIQKRIPMTFHTWKRKGEPKQ